MEKLLLGKIINTRGLRGQIKIDNYSSFIKERYKSGNIVFLSNNERDYASKKIINFSYVKGFVYLFLEGIESIDEANKYRDYYVYCDDDILNENDETYHLVTLKKLKVIFKGKDIGRIIDIESNGKQDLIRIDTGSKTFLVPFLEEFIKEINKEENYIELVGIEVFYEN